MILGYTSIVFVVECSVVSICARAGTIDSLGGSKIICLTQPVRRHLSSRQPNTSRYLV